MNKANDSERIRSFWDEKAKEDPFWYVSSYGKYGGGRDLDDFWSSGRRIWHDLKTTLAYYPKPTDKVVEIGCGVGRLTRAIAAEVLRVQAVDISSEMLNIAEKICPDNVTFSSANGFDLATLEDGSVDLVLGYCVFQHLPTLAGLREYIAEMVRIAKPEGFIAFTLTPRDWRYYLLPLARFRTYLREHGTHRGAKGLYRREWVGIRPTQNEVCQISPISLTATSLYGDKWLFYGNRPA
jgi:2-polyprenyl-3-methyl-5-hydroxy-6-metoxy-1,4-benzoquinol methylase